MKKVINVGIGNRSFVINEDAYERLKAYLDAFNEKTNMGYQTKEVMEELEMRIAEIFTESLKGKQEVVNIELVNHVISLLGFPDGSNGTFESGSKTAHENYTQKRFYRDGNNNMLGGICSGLGIYFNVDITVIRLLFAVGIIFGLLSFWVYVIFWIIVPKAKTPTQKCEMRGLPATAENIRKFSTVHQ